MINLDSAHAFGTGEGSAGSLPEALESLRLLARRTDQLLVLARLDEHAELPFVRVDLARLVEDVIAEWSPTVDRTRFTLAVNVPTGLPSVDGYPAALSAMLRNLLENAARHVPAGGHVALSVTAVAREITVDVVDDGPGIPAARRAAVFTRFHREATSLGDGFGVGLSIVQRVAQLHHATVSLEDGPRGRGLMVRVRLPVAALASGAVGC